MMKPYVNKAKKLSWVQSVFAGIDALIDDNLRQDYTLTNVKGVYGSPLAEFVFSYILYFEKEILENTQLQQQKKWNQKAIPVIKGKTICILGTGSIGQEIARVAKTFGMNVFGYRNYSQLCDGFDSIFTGRELKEFLAPGDYVINVLPSTIKTRGIFTLEKFSWMKKTATFINIGRGDAVVEDDLYQAIQEQKIARAVLDVFQEEPLPEHSLLWNYPNIYITSHIAGYILSEKNFQIFAENYQRFIAGKELLYQIDFKKGY